jgi:hypothetical protein
MQLKRPTAGLLVASTLGLASVALPATPVSAAVTHKRPLLESLTYTPTTEHGSDGFLEAKYTATIRLYQSAPSITFTIDSVGTHNFATEAGPEKSYRAGVHKVSFTYDALPGGTFRITLFARVRPSADSPSLRSPAPIKSSDPATLVVKEAGEGEAGTGMVTKI